MQNITEKHTSGNNRKRLLDFIRRKISNDSDAEDILQDVFYNFWDTLQSEPIEQVAAWLYRVAENKIIDWYRKRRPVSLDALNASRSESGEDDDSFLHLEDMLFNSAETPDEVYARSTVWTMIGEALDELPPEQKEVFVMHELDGKSFKEISEQTGVSVNTLLSRKRYAVIALREQLQELYDDYLAR